MADETPIIQIEGYYDEEALAPTAYRAYMARRTFLRDEVRAGQWATVVLDSLTSNAIAARKWDEYGLNPNRKGKTGKDDGWAPFNAATTMLENDALRSLSALPCHVGIIAHVDAEKNTSGGILAYGPNAPGRLANLLPTQFPEMYYSFTTRDDDKTLHYLLQTRNDGLHSAGTQLDVPDPCEPTFEALWQNADTLRDELIHAIVYGAAATGKSTFLATFPKPMLVLSFDGRGKETPYLRLGEATKWQRATDGDGRDLGYDIRWVYAR